MMIKKPDRKTMQSVADRAGVSMATVSHVMNETRFVSDATKALVRQAILDVDYVPNTLARDLARNSTSTIGLVFSLTTNRFFLDIVSAIEAECNRAGLSVLLFDSGDDPEKELRIVRDLHHRRADGIVLAPSGGPESAAIRYLHNNKVPVVLVDRLAGGHLDQVGLDNFRAISLLTDHLQGVGHRRIAFVPGQASYVTTQERIAAFRATMAEQGLSETAIVAPPSNSLEDAEANVAALLAPQDRPDAILAGNNLCTIGAMRAILAAGLHVPKDIALAGIDDFEWADLFEPRLTVVRQPCAGIGEAAATLIRERIKSPNAPPQTLRLSPTLVVRNSCGFGKERLTRA